jgi:phosphoribosylaminoimidazolecarboxamide formyltransferase / IMP cyclohydrolase
LEKFALISVSDKTDILPLAKALQQCEYKIIATGNTARMLSSEEISVTTVDNLTGFPEIFNGRVKTLHPKIFGGILMRRDNQKDIDEAEQNQIFPIDVVCVNLYPFKEVTKDRDINLDTAIENIDIGGPSLIRAAAKNFNYVSVLTNPSQYKEFISELSSGSISFELRKKLAVAAFSHTSDYDTHIANFLEGRFNFKASHIRINYPLSSTLRYGENPHQKAEIYGDFAAYFDILHGKELSYNNILDLIASVELVEELGGQSCAIIKHTNPAGAAIGNDPLIAYKEALKCDPVSAFGGIVAFNSIVDEEVAHKLNEIFLEVISAQGYTDSALEILFKKKNRRIVKQKKSVIQNDFYFKTIPGGIIKQDADKIDLLEDQLKVVTERKPTTKEMEDLRFAWKIAKHTKSNAIVFVRDKSALGVGAGQMSRLDSVKIAKMKAETHGLDLNNSIAASDAFFPFADGLVEIINCGAKAVIQPGGSVRDEEAINAANKHNISMVFTGIRHFKH